MRSFPRTRETRWTPKSAWKRSRRCARSRTSFRWPPPSSGCRTFWLRRLGRLSQNVLHPLEGGGQRKEVLLLAHRLDRFHALFGVHRVSRVRGKDRIYRIGTAALLLEKEPEALEEEGRELLQHLVPLSRQPAVQRGRVGAGRRKVEAPLPVEQDLHDPERRAPERVRIPRSGRCEAEAKETRERVEPV